MSSCKISMGRIWMINLIHLASRTNDPPNILFMFYFQIFCQFLMVEITHIMHFEDQYFSLIL